MNLAGPSEQYAGEREREISRYLTMTFVHLDEIRDPPTRPTARDDSDGIRPRQESRNFEINRVIRESLREQGLYTEESFLLAYLLDDLNPVCRLHSESEIDILYAEKRERENARARASRSQSKIARCFFF